MRVLIEHNAFDTEIFGLSCAKLVLKTSAKKGVALKDVVNRLQKARYQYATVRLPIENYQAIHEFEDMHFRLVDMLVSLETKSLSAPLKPAKRYIHEAGALDEAECVKIASSTFGLTRVFNDPIIPKRNARLFYAQWVKNSFSHTVADMVLVWKEKNKVLGFVTIQKNGHIPLVAVSKTAQGRGIARMLVAQALAQCRKWGLKNSQIETQVGNYAALRSYMSCGFKVVGAVVTLRWSGELKNISSSTSTRQTPHDE